MGNFITRYFPFSELPQNVLGRIISRAWKNWLDVIDDSTLEYVQDFENKNKIKIYVVTEESHNKHFLLKGINSHSLGKYICIVNSKNPVTFEKCIKHEALGHVQQSKYWKRLYLPVIGLPSVMRNLWNRVAHKNWPPEKKSQWYFSGWPENDADKRGGVKR
jgi:hypothetical protein